MKKTMASAYTDMMANLVKSTSAIPLHLQPAAGALAWWESPDSLMAKSEIDDTDELKKSSAEHETDEAYEEDAKHDGRDESNAENDVHGGDGSEEEGDDESEEDEKDESEMEKSLGALDAIASDMLAKGTVVGTATPDDEGRSPKYNKESVDRAITASNRAGRKIGSKEAKLIHQLLQGRHETPDAQKAMAELDTLADAMLAKAKKRPKGVGDSYLPGQLEMMFDEAASKPVKKQVPVTIDGSKKIEMEDPYNTPNFPRAWRGDHPVKDYD